MRTSVIGVDSTIVWKILVHHTSMTLLCLILPFDTNLKSDIAVFIRILWSLSRLSFTADKFLNWIDLDAKFVHVFLLLFFL